MTHSHPGPRGQPKASSQVLWELGGRQGDEKLGVPFTPHSVSGSISNMAPGGHSWRGQHGETTQWPPGDSTSVPKEVSLSCLGHVLLTRALLHRAVAAQVMHDAVVNFSVKPKGHGCHGLRGELRASEPSPQAGDPGPTTQPGLLTWAAPSSLVGAALAWSWGHWSTSISSTSLSWSPPTASFICRDQSRAQFPTPSMGHGLRGAGVGM